MSGATAIARAARRPARRGWLQSLRDEAVSFLKGDNNSPWAILAETVIGCVPVLGQVVDARDIIKGLVAVSGAPASPLAWFDLITALIGLIPGAGDATKRGLRSVKAGATHVDDLLDMIRRFYRGDPERALREALDLSAIRRHLDRILDNPNLTRRLSPEVRRSIDNIQANLGRQFDAFKREVDSWLHRGRRTSAAPGAGTRGRARPGTPPAKPGTNARAGSTNRSGRGNSASPNTPNAASQRTARFKTLSNKMLGVLGEHMADYHCQDTKGWGAKMRHDEYGVNNAKLNDGGHLVQLWPVVARGRGLDAVWKSNGPKPYAVIEAKASYSPIKGLAALLGEAGDKTDSGNGAGTQSSGRGGGAGGRGRGGSGGATRQTNGKVTQMSRGWIDNRLAKAIGASEALKARRLGYSRHVLFFSIPQAVAHAEALIMHTARQRVDPNMHRAHQVTREWRDSDIERVVDNRAGFAGAGRDARTR
jgi:hypothetical protein